MSMLLCLAHTAHATYLQVRRSKAGDKLDDGDEGRANMVVVVQ